MQYQIASGKTQKNAITYPTVTSLQGTTTLLFIDNLWLIEVPEQPIGLALRGPRRWPTVGPQRHHVVGRFFDAQPVCGVGSVSGAERQGDKETRRRGDKEKHCG